MQGATVARKRRRLASPIGGGNKAETIHDRQAQDLLRNAQVAPVVVDDPYGTETGEKIVVFRSLRDDPLAALHAHHQIDQAEYMAGRHWQKAYELAELGGVGAIDPTKEAVDGGKCPEPMSDIQARAFDDLRRSNEVLGREGQSIVHDVLARGMPLLHVAAARGMTTQRELLYVGRRFRECLSTLAVTFGYAMKGRA